MNEAAGLQGRARHSLDGQTRTGSEPDDETTRRLAQQIEEWGREQNGPDIVSIAKAYVGIQKMAEEVRLPNLEPFLVPKGVVPSKQSSRFTLHRQATRLVIICLQGASMQSFSCPTFDPVQEALKHRFNMIKHDAIRLRPEAAHLFLSLQRDDFEDLDDTPLPRHCTK